MGLSINQIKKGVHEMNKVILVGRLGKDPETRYTQNGKCVATFSLAVSKPVKDSGADWFDIVVWDK